MAIVTIKKGVCIHHYPVADTNFKLKATVGKSGVMQISMAQLKLVANSTDRVDMARFPDHLISLPFNTYEVLVY